MPALTSLTPDFDAVASSTLTFFLNGTKVQLDGSSIDPDTSLLAFIRSQPGLTGTKQGCNEGGCVFFFRSFSFPCLYLRLP